MLYNTEFKVRSGDFRIYDNPLHDGKVIGCSWEIPVVNVSRGVPDPQGFGVAEITFLSLKGCSVTEFYRPVAIPSLP